MEHLKPAAAHGQRSGNMSVANIAGRAIEGSWYAGFNGGDTTPNGVLEQTFTTVAGRKYRVAFEVGKQATGSGNASFLMEMLDAGNGDASLASLTASEGTGASPANWSHHVVYFTAGSTSTTLKFTDQSSNGGTAFDTYLDNIEVRTLSEYEQVILNQNARQYWRLDNLSGSDSSGGETASDTERMDRNATGVTTGNTGAPTLSGNSFPGMSTDNRWWDFNGSAGAVSGIPACDMVADQGSVSYWCRAGALTGHEIHYYGSLANGQNGWLESGKNDHNTGFRSDGTLAYALKWLPNGGSTRTTINTYNDDQWHHVAFTWDVNSTKLWVDGGLTETVVNGPGSRFTGAFAQGQRFGKGFNNIYEYSGYADELAVWTNALSSEQVAQQYLAATELHYDRIEYFEITADDGDGADAYVEGINPKQQIWYGLLPHD